MTFLGVKEVWPEVHNFHCSIDILFVLTVPHVGGSVGLISEQRGGLAFCAAQPGSNPGTAKKETSAAVVSSEPSGLRHLRP